MKTTNKITKIDSILLITLTILTIMITKTTQNQLDINKVRVVDFAYSNEFNDTDKFNIIFRSNIPEDKSYSTFEYDKLIDYMIEIAFAEKLIKIDKNDVYILDFSLLQEKDSMRTTEVKYFEENPEKGEIRGWSVLGEKKNPADYSLDDIIKKSKDLKWMDDPIEDWIDEIHNSLLDFTRDKHLLILVHCHYGKDRTGEISGGYQLKYGHQSWEEVSATNWEMYKDSIVYDNQRALTWFCYHLQYHSNYSHLKCTNENLSQKDEIKPDMVGWDIENYDQVDGWEIAFFSILSCTIFGILFVIFVVILIGLFLSRNLIGRKVADIGKLIRKRRENGNGNKNENGYENVQLEINNQISLNDINDNDNDNENNINNDNENDNAKFV